jgi:response regulator RpfG family c-di-GMP phosphodiesterase
MTNNDDLIFADESQNNYVGPCGKPWKLLVVDDDAFVHKVTTMVLEDYKFEGCSLHMLNAQSAEEGKAILLEHKDIAVILLDVVMETSHAGLDLAEWIRNDLGNDMIRIILRTGQPGEAPEQDVIFRYDINDYKEKSELTSQKLATTVTTAIRSYRDIRTIEQNRAGLARIVEASPNLFKTQSLGEFASGVLSLLSSSIGSEDNTLIARVSGLAASKSNGEFKVIASTGLYENDRGNSLAGLNDDRAIGCIEQAIKSKQNFFSGECFAGYYRTASGSENIIYIQGAGPIQENNQHLIEIFSSNISVAFDNIDLNQTIAETQRELLFTLGEVMETRSSETANHVRRVAEYSYLIALKMGVPQDEADRLKLASPMHDVGKIGIPDSVLLKPDKLNNEEFDIVKQHTLIGHDILRRSPRQVLQTAAKVALQHHERWDGNGYPHGLKGKDICWEGRVTMIADVFDALGTTRIYKKAWPIGNILAFIEEGKGNQFDPDLVNIFMQNLDEILAIRDSLPDDAQ